MDNGLRYDPIGSRSQLDLIAEVSYDRDQCRNRYFEVAAEALRTSQLTRPLNFSGFQLRHAGIEVLCPTIERIEPLIDRCEAVRDALIQTDQKVTHILRDRWISHWRHRQAQRRAAPAP